MHFVVFRASCQFKGALGCGRVQEVPLPFGIMVGTNSGQTEDARKYTAVCI